MRAWKKPLTTLLIERRHTRERIVIVHVVLENPDFENHDVGGCLRGGSHQTVSL